MSRLAINLLIDSGLVTASGKPVSLSDLPNDEVSARISQYINGRAQTINGELDSFDPSSGLNALFGSESTEATETKILPSALVYQSIIIDDPLVSASSTISLATIEEGVRLFCAYFHLIKLDFVKVIPLSLFNRPSDEVPLLHSDDAFRSSIPDDLHDFIHSRARLKSVVRDLSGRMLVLNEGASEKRRPALNVGFSGDFWKKGVQLYLFQTIEKVGEIDGGIRCKRVWEPEECLDEEKFDQWAYQTINQAMRVRLKNIYNETRLAGKLGHTYVTESEFESELLSRSGTENVSSSNRPCKFFDANKALISVDGPETIIELRERYPAALERFNSSVLYAVEHLKDVEPENFETKAQLYFTNEILPQIDELRNNARTIARSAAKGALVSLGGITTAMLSGSALPLIPSLMVAAAGGASETLDSVGRHQDFKKTPVYIWHRITKT
ncbi:hypothetical protein [Isoalcanivorax pacificus]|uniref:hypothetical protein n=1 Tax=Isoalcanivorax pacificus TaxID=1306787 RepID=UPI0002E896AD|nr:hypothetical protein [Isoalcanivorax pacificus]